MDIIKVSILGIAGVLLSILLKQSKAEYAVYISLMTGILILFFAVWKLQYLFDAVKKLQEFIPIESTYITTLLKMIGITYIGQFSSGICKDAGYSSISNQIEVFSKLSIMVISLPIMLALLDTIKGFLI